MMRRDPSLVFWLPLRELDGASFASKDAYGHAGTVVGAFWTPQGWYFDGVDDKISFGNPTALQITAQIALEAVVRLDALGNYRDIIAKHPLGAAADNAFLLRSADTNLLDFSICDGVAYDSLTGTTALVTGKWYHIVASWSPLAMILVVNGKLDSSLTPARSAINNPAQNLVIGNCSHTSTNQTWSGLIAEAAGYNRGTTVVEAQLLYHQAKKRCPWL